MGNPPPASAASKDQDPGAALCLACGICCQGALHRIATIEDADVERARACGLRLVPNGERTAFVLPCVRFDGCCTIYADRPGACRKYECRLLQRQGAGEVTHEDALARVREAQERLADVRRILGPDAGGLGIWRAVEALAQREGHAADSASFRRRHGELVLALTLLGRVLDRHFRPKDSADP